MRRPVVACSLVWALAATTSVGVGTPDAQASQSTSGAGSVWAGVYTEAQAARGEAAYLDTCGSCHGAQMEGGDMTPPLVGGVFSANWNDLTIGDLFERIRLTMPLDRPGKLTRQQNADVIALILKANAWPAGETELPTAVAALKQITIVSSRP